MSLNVCNWSPPRNVNFADTVNAAICSGIIWLLPEVCTTDLVLWIGVNCHLECLSESLHCL